MMYILLFHTALLKCFIYSRVKASQILHGAVIPVARTKNQVNTISIYFIRKKFPFKLYNVYPQEKSNHKKRHAYLTYLLLKKCLRRQHLSESEDLYACKTSDLFFWLIFLRKLFTINGYYKISTFLIDEHCYVNLPSFQCHLYQYYLQQLFVNVVSAILFHTYSLPQLCRKNCKSNCKLQIKLINQTLVK